MDSLVHALWETYSSLFLSSDLTSLLVKFFPFALLLEVPLYLVILLGLIKGRMSETVRGQPADSFRSYFPPVSCIISSYSEGEEIIRTIRTLAEQIYPGRIQLIQVVDGAAQNRKTYEAALSMVRYVKSRENRDMVVVPNWQRGGRVPALNAGLQFADGEIVLALDADTSFDNDMVWNATRHFSDPAVFCVAGNLRVRNMFKSLLTRLQSVEYFLSLNAARKGLAEFNLLDNVSGAFGIFRKSALEAIGGWDAGTAEDLDLTLRIKNYFGRYKWMKIKFDPDAVGHTDVPDTLRGLLRQRLRWDGDLPFIYLTKHKKSFSPSMVGYRNFVLLILHGLLVQLVMPFMILLYLTFVFFLLPFRSVLALGMLIYIFYTLITLIIWMASILLASERAAQDLKMTPWVLLMPFYGMLLKINGMFSILWEFFGKGHEDTTMAPWWTTKKSKFGRRPL